MIQGSFLSHEPPVWQGVDSTDTYQLAALWERSRCHKSSPASLPVKTESVLKAFSMGLLSRSSERITQSFATWVGENGTVRSRSGDVRRSTNCPARACAAKSVPPALLLGIWNLHLSLASTSSADPWCVRSYISPRLSIVGTCFALAREAWSARRTSEICPRGGHIHDETMKKVLTALSVSERI